MDILAVLVYLLVFICLVWGGFYIIGNMGLPEPIGMFARVVFGVICLIVLVGALTGSIPMPSFSLRR